MLRYGRIWGIDIAGLDGRADGAYFEIGQWYHIAGVNANQELVAYVDGEEKGRIDIPTAIAQGPGEGDTGGLHVGNSPAYGGPAAKFIIDELAVYDRGLSADEVVRIMAGDLTTAVEPTSKLISTWGDMKSQY